MFPDVSELGREVDVFDCEVVHAGLELCCKHCGGRLWGRRPADGDDLAAQIHFHDNLSLLVGKGLEVSFDNDGLTSFQVFLRSEVGTVQPLFRRELFVDRPDPRHSDLLPHRAGDERGDWIGVFVLRLE